jgi:ParB family transcriptional regulator, chromosome partitioning protein
MRLAISQIRANPDQPRKRFEPTALAELAASIKSNGLLQPITVRLCAPDPHCCFGGDQHGALAQYEIVAGERRWRAHQLAGLAEIEANVVEFDDDAMAIGAIVENLQRADITPLEEARAFQRMLDAGYTPVTLAHRLGIKQAFRISDRVQLLRLRPEYLALFERNALTSSQATELSRLAPGSQDALFSLIKSGRAETYNRLRAAADGLLQAEQQSAMFELPPAPTDEELATLTKFERMVERLVSVCGEGIRDSEVVVLRRIDPSRAGTMVAQLGAIRASLGHMETALQRQAAQAELVRS